MYLETGCFFDVVLRSRWHAVFRDNGGFGIGHFEGDELMELWGMNTGMNYDYLLFKVGG